MVAFCFVLQSMRLAVVDESLKGQRTRSTVVGCVSGGAM
jgi:hypothetical protein